jgi:hypothetical protein
MRRFSSYGPVDKDVHYYVPREDLIERVLMQLLGENPEKGGHYITIWAPRQTGKTWALLQAFSRLRKDKTLDVISIGVETMKMEEDIVKILNYIGKHIARNLNKKTKKLDSPEDFEDLFSKESLEKPLILIIDEFDALSEKAIAAIVGCFRNIYNMRQRDSEKSTGEKDYLLHSVALIGVRSVLGVENLKGSPFNVQRSVHIPNLTFEEVESMFRWHERESEQTIDQDVIERLYYETKGQPGLTSWFGELVTEGCYRFEVERNKHIDMKLFDRAYKTALNVLPNNNILNIISKAKQEPYKDVVLNLFKTDKQLLFKHDDIEHNFLYMNGVIDIEETSDVEYYIKFSCPFVQKRLFNYFANEITGYVGKLYEPFEDLDDAINDTELNVKNIMKRYRSYLLNNREWLLKNAPRRSDMKIYEAVFHFNLYMYLSSFIGRFDGEVYPEFPTGNGKIDIIVKYKEKIYGIELKTYTDISSYKKALKQAAHYGRQLSLKQISLIFFVEAIDDESRKKYEVDFDDEETGVKVEVIFVEIGN